MSELAIQPINSVLDTPLAGFDAIGSWQVRQLPDETVFATANRFLRCEFPPQRNHDLYLQLVNKGIMSPQLSLDDLDRLPVKILETLAKAVLQISVRAEGPDCPIDLVLTLVQLLEAASQYTQFSLVSEDLAWLETNQLGGLHSYFFKPKPDVQHLTQVLQSEGFRSDLMAFVPDYLEPYMAYWLCRNLTVIFPWSALLDRFTEDRAHERYPYLYRMKLVRDFLAKQLAFGTALSAKSLIEDILPQLILWMDDEFHHFSQKAQVPCPLQELVLVEGSTEELLIPAIAKVLGYNLNYEGILIQPVGGKNQILQTYVSEAEYLAIPIIIVMDQDAQGLIPDLQYYQRKQDRILILEEGEFEDLYALDLIAKTINEHYATHPPVTVEMLRQSEHEGRAKALQALWNDMAMGDFNKVAFAQQLVDTLSEEEELSEPMKRLIGQMIEAKEFGKNVSPG